MPNPSLDGVAAIGTYGSGVLETDIAELKALIPDPDSTSTSGAQAGGGNLDQMSPGAAAQLRVELDALAAAGATAGVFASGQHTVTAGEASANQVDIVTGLANLDIADTAVSVYRSGSLVTSDAVITEPSAGTIRIADGSTYNTTAGDKINWAVVGPVG